MHRAAAAAPAMAYRGERPPSPRHDQMQVARILDRRNEMLVIVGIDVQLERALAPPVAATLEFTHRVPRQFTQPSMHIGARHAGFRADSRVFWTHRHHHVGAHVHVP